MVSTAIYSVTMVLWKETAFPLCRAMERRREKCCLPDIFCDSGDTPANLLCELNGHLMPCTSCFYGKWVEDVCAGHYYYAAFNAPCVDHKDDESQTHNESQVYNSTTVLLRPKITIEQNTNRKSYLASRYGTKVCQKL